MGMQLLDFLKGLTKPDREAFAAKCGTSVDYLFQIAYGERTPKVGLVVAIERESAARCVARRCCRRSMEISALGAATCAAR
jgi:hypothetical protein